jgi:DNA-binding MarR family transcriptional regulator
MTTDLKQVFDDLVRFETDLWNGVDARLRGELGLSMGFFDPMQAISRTPSCRVQDVAGALSITVGGASKAVDRIEAAGLCERRANPQDRRSSIVELTPAGVELHARATAVFEAELRERLESPLSGDALAHLARALGTLRAAGR